MLDTVHGFFFSLEECRNTLMQLGVREITPPSIARVLGMMARSPTGVRDHISVQVSSLCLSFPPHSLLSPLLDSFVCTQALGATNNLWLDTRDNVDVPVTWNVDVFVQATKDLVSVSSHFSVAATSS